MKFSGLFLGLLVCAGGAGPVWAKLTPAQVAQLPPPAAGKVNFTQDIKPILEASCVKCHAKGKAKGGFNFDTRETFFKGGDSGPTAVAGKSAESQLIELVSGLDPDNVMPQKGSKLTPKQIGLLRAWIDQGMPWDAGVSFAKKPYLNLTPRAPQLPPARGNLTHPVDRLLDGYFARHRLKSSAPVDDRAFARRVHLDVLGLLPTPKEMDAFLADRRADKRGRLVEQLLADNPRYAAHWLSFWNDLLRNDYRGTGYIDGGREQITGWLYNALAKNLPFDQFVVQLIDPTKESAGFAKGIVWRGAVNASQTPPIQAAQNISQIFLGVNLKCASCHDSFINDWALADAYGLASVYADAPLEMFECDKPTGKKAGVKFIFPELGEIKADAPRAEKQKRLAELMTQRNNGRLTRTVVNRLWARCLGRGLVEPVDDLDQAAWNADVLDWLAEDLAANGYDLKRTLKLILTSRAYQLPSVSLDDQKHADYVFAGPVIRRLTAEQFRDAFAAVTGVWFDAPNAVVDFSAGVTNAPAVAYQQPPKWIWSQPQAATRALAETIYLRQTIVLPEAPAEAWAVAACDNSYTLYVNGVKVGSGKEFTQPNAWGLRSQLKKGTNVIAIAAVNHTPANQPPPADKPPVESEANPAGLLFHAQIRSGGRSIEVSTDSSWIWSAKKVDGWEKTAFAATNWQTVAELGEADLAPWKLGNKPAQVLAAAKSGHDMVRASLVTSDPLTTALGRPPREQVVTTRPATATTLQALELTNGETLAKLLKRATDKLLAGNSAASDEVVTQLYRKALGRAPTARELRLSIELIGSPIKKEGVEDLLWAMVMLPEFQLIY